MASPAVSADSPYKVSRTSRSRRRYIPIVALALIAVLAVGGVAAFAAWRNHVAREEIAARIGAIVSDLQTCDGVVVPLDDALSSDIDGSEASAADAFDDHCDEAASALDAAQGKIDDLRAGDVVLTDEETEIVGHLETSVDARREMLAAGRELLHADAALAAAQPLAQEGMGKMVEANNTVLDSVAAANEYAKVLAGENDAEADPQVPVDLDNKALALLDEAKTSLADAKAAFPDADFSACEAYVAAKTEAVELLLEIDNAIASERYNEASRKVDAYNEADARATEAAASVPSSADEILREPYENMTADARARYNEARHAAAESDTAIRAYAGVDMGVFEGDGSQADAVVVE